MADDKRAERVAVGRKMLEKFKKKNKDSLTSPRKNSLEDSGGTLIKDQKVETTIPHYSEPFSSTNGNPVPVMTPSFQEHRNTPSNNNSTIQETMVTQVASAHPQVLFNTSPVRMRHNSACDFFDNLPSKVSNFNQPTPFQIHQQEEATNDNAQNTTTTNPVALFQYSSTEPSSAKSTPSSTQMAYPLQNTPDLLDQSMVSARPVLKDIDIQFQESEIKALEEQERNKLLENKLKEYKTDMNRLEETLASVRKEKDTKIAALEEKLELHCKTLEIIVGEKTELQNALSKNQEELQVKLGEIEELQSRLKASRHRVFDLEREVNHMNAQHQQFEKAEKQAKDSVTALNTELFAVRKRLEEREEEIVDLRGQLDGRAKTLIALEQELGEKQSLLALAQLRVQQLSGVDGIPTSEVDQLQQDKLQLEQRVSELEKLVNQARAQIDESGREYQQYINSLNLQIQNLVTKNNEQNHQLGDSKARSQQLIQHVSDLEKQLQNQNRLRVPVLPQVDPALQKQVLQLQEEKNELEARLQEQTAECEKLKDLLDNKSECIEKLETTLDMLDSEKLDAVSLQAAIESDKVVAASRAMAQNSSLKKQLEELQDAFVKLSNNKLELTEKLEHTQHLSQDLKVRLEQLQAQKQNQTEVDRSQQTDSALMFTSSVQTLNTDNQQPTPPAVSAEAMNKLEEKFCKTMKELAVLSDEKQRLEHLVEQLQFETDTIGEYVALYQTQRGLLRQRVQEKDEQVTKLAQEKESLRQKLAQLNCLIQGLLDGKPHHHQNGYDMTTLEVAAEVVENNQLHENVEEDPSKQDTADKIKALISDITSNKLMSHEGMSDHNINFHPCPWCSGRLITV